MRFHNPLVVLRDWFLDIWDRLARLRGDLRTPAAIGFLADLAAIVLFAAVGRASHDESLDAAGVARTALPFILACSLTWMWLAATKRTGVHPREGVGMWIMTVGGGIGLRLAFGDGAAWPFVLVASITLAVLLIGWRALFLAGWRYRLRQLGLSPDPDARAERADRVERRKAPTTTAGDDAPAAAKDPRKSGNPAVRASSARRKDADR